MSGLITAVSLQTIIHAAASQTHLPVGEDQQQRQCFSVSNGCQPGTVSEAVQEGGLAVQVRVLQADAAVWLPARQGCLWPVNIMIEVAVLAAEVVPGGVDVTVVADAVTAAQRVVLAHGAPLPLRLQHALSRPARSGSRLGTTAFSVQEGRRSGHIKVMEEGVWVREHFVFPALSFLKHSNMHHLSLMFAASAEAAAAGGLSDAHIASTILLPRTVSMRSSADVCAALRVLSLPEDIFERICDHRNPVPAGGKSTKSGHTASCATAGTAAAKNPGELLLPPRADIAAKTEQSTCAEHKRCRTELQAAPLSLDMGQCDGARSTPLTTSVRTRDMESGCGSAVHSGHPERGRISIETRARLDRSLGTAYNAALPLSGSLLQVRDHDGAHRPPARGVGAEEGGHGCGVGSAYETLRPRPGVPRVPRTLPSLDACEALLTELLHQDAVVPAVDAGLQEP